MHACVLIWGEGGGGAFYKVHYSWVVTPGQQPPYGCVLIRSCICVMQEQHREQESENSKLSAKVLRLQYELSSERQRSAVLSVSLHPN